MAGASKLEGVKNMSNPLNVIVWNEEANEKSDPDIRTVYPDGIHAVIADGLKALLPADSVIRTATLSQPEHGLDAETLNATDVLVWWGHHKHPDVSDEVVERIYRRVMDGMGLILLHSSHWSKIFVRFMGTDCSIRYRNDGEQQVLWPIFPSHPIADGVSQAIVVPKDEMYGEYFDIPIPDEIVFLSTFEGGEVFRSGITYFRGNGRIFYFSPGHETYPVYYQPEIQQVLANAVKWARPSDRLASLVHTDENTALQQRGWYL
jgi:trehalose utilization protein